MSAPDPHEATRTAAPPDADSTKHFPADPDATVTRHRHPPAGASTVAVPTTTPTPDGVHVPGYQITGVLGRGGMGVVYHARHLALKREVALKMILSGRHAGPLERERFRTEAEAVARLQHPNIVQVHDIGEADGHPYFALEFVAGGTLAGKTDGKPLPAAEAARTVEALARAMHLAHSRNIVHRDLKPANVLLTPDGVPKITDFGLARRLDDDGGDTHTGAVLGTPSYMAPEQAAGRTSEAGPAADVYSLGAILYDCLTGGPPFKGESTARTLELVRTGEPVPPSRRHPSVPPDLETICLKCLQKPPEKRYPSAAELADDLGRYLRGEPILARPVSAWERAVKWARRRPTAAALVAAGVFLFVGATAFSLLFAERERQSAHTLENKNTELIQEQAAKDVALKQSRVSQARLALDRGLILCEQGDTARGLVALTQALAAAVAAEDADLEAAIRLNLAAWERQTWRVRTVLPSPQGHSAQAVALNPDGTVLAVALSDQTVQLRDVSEAREDRLLRVLSHKGDAATMRPGVSFTPDGRSVIARTNKVVHVWDAGTGNPACPPLRHDEQMTAMAVDPNGQYVVTGDAVGVGRIWDLATGEPRELPTGRKVAVDAVAVRADGKKVLTGTRLGVVRVWDAESGAAEGGEIALKGGGVTSAAFSRAGDTLVVGTRSGFAVGTVHLLNAASGQPVCPPLACDGPVEEVAFGAGEKTVVVRTGVGAVSAGVRVWHPTTDAPTTPLPHRGDVRCFALTPDGKTVFTGGSGAARGWDVDRGTQAGATLYHGGPVAAAAFNRDGRTLATLDGDVRVWQAPPTVKRAVLPHPGQVYAIAVSGDGRLTLTGGQKGARLWRTATGEPVGDTLPHPGDVTAVVFSPDGKLALTAGGDKAARLWDAATGTPRGTLAGHTAAIAAAAFSPDGAVVLTGGFDGTARLWSVPSGERAGEPLAHTRGVEAVAFSADGATAYTGSRYADAIRSWGVPAGDERPSLVGHQTGVWALAATPRWLVSGGADGTARFWETDSGRALGTPVQHQDVVRAVAVGPDGTTALTASYDGTARRSHVPTGLPVGPTFHHRGKIRDAALSPDGRTAGTASWDGTAILWDTPPALPGTPEQVAVWAGVLTGLEADDGGAVRPLGAVAWNRLRQGAGRPPALSR